VSARGGGDAWHVDVRSDQRSHRTDRGAGVMTVLDGRDQTQMP
jgi:hypothetical protein